MKENVKISVRFLVEHVFRSGSIEEGMRSMTAMAEGTRIHQSIQRTYDENAEKEVYLQTTITHRELEYHIDGRCDGLLFDGDEVTIDEIKSTSADINQITSDTHPVHWAQAKFYAYMYCASHDKNKIKVQLTYVQAKTNEVKRFQQAFTIEELSHFVFVVVEQYAPYAELLKQHEARRNESIKQLTFPFETYREGQRKLTGAVYKTILDKKQLFANAPTGVGKTISTTFPALKAIGEGALQKFFYLTARTITRTVAEESLSLMAKDKLVIHSVTITAKEKACINEKMLCQSETCPFANGHFDRINAAILDILKSETIMVREVIEKYARKHRVCPFEFSLDLAYIVDVVICDYNYIFDPRVSLKRQYEEQKKKTAILIDEAHQLVDRGRDMYSAELNLSLFQQIQQAYKSINNNLYEVVCEIVYYFELLKREAGKEKNLSYKEMQEEIITLVDSFVFIAEQELSLNGTGQEGEALLQGYFSALGFLRVAPLYDERFITYVEVEEEDIKIKMFCIDPSHLLQKMAKGFHSKIFFSATMSPFLYYQEMLGISNDNYAVSINSPFTADQAKVYIQPISTRFKDRDLTKLDLVNMLIKETRVKGNYLIFFPSYHYLSEVYSEFVSLAPEVETIVQHSSMTELEREDFIASYDAENNNTLVGFAVLGGIFSEGIDLKGERLSGVFIIGVGLPRLSFERDLMKRYFDSIGKNGYDFAYVYPGMNKVLQAGGRLIRTENDRGKIVLVDDRFLSSKYKQLLPKEWTNYELYKLR
ncbi:ATP-dependent helicase [Lottiidibacillus patelloidae]|uniref:ATP-dependent helicase n=1 Tax=Lottiidibacillus patelloidae TaxID=2670334 RepID=A0A263BS16_9BACI|nr:helicase C-terminal domain-containing protein [Lottiidibacillus patelloidae]OZM56157.1 ATP-dependent helicase [Lottiidibacillus patelloidae]